MRLKKKNPKTRVNVNDFSNRKVSGQTGGQTNTQIYTCHLPSMLHSLFWTLGVMFVQASVSPHLVLFGQLIRPSR